jgi:Uma2 family endonuclease
MKQLLDPLTVDQYFRLPETLRPMELVYGVVREPPAPRFGHQSIVTVTTVLLDQHVRTHGLGKVCVSPVDVVLDRGRALVVQPDVIFVATERLGIIDERVWGAPDLIVEVLSKRTARRDRTEKLGWYRQYDVRECWFLDPARRTVEIIYCQSSASGEVGIYRGEDLIRSHVLPDLQLPAREFFA